MQIVLDFLFGKNSNLFYMIYILCDCISSFPLLHNVNFTLGELTRSNIERLFSLFSTRRPKVFMHVNR